MKIQENALYRHADGSSHCRHGIVYTVKDSRDQIWAIDTYWDNKFSKGLTNDGYCYLAEEIADKLELVMFIDDVLEVSRDEFYLYNDKDVLYVPVGGWHERYLVNKNAKKNIEIVIEFIKAKIDSNEREIRNLTSDNEKLSQWLYCVKVNHDIAQLYKNEKYELKVELAMENAWGKKGEGK
ncbi:hypothetical protein ABHN03_03845 [Paenibacillus sp. NRS-1775]|uniref:hypothetical protein n=1 Tax=unclassified Paenibacillus TaxID=185978 RepID=UPI003D267FD9